MSHLFSRLTDPNIAELLTSGNIGVIKTDTIYGIVASTLDEQAVERVYAVRGRDKNKPSIVLISSLDDLYDSPIHDEVRRYWPGKVSIILPSPSAPDYLTRAGETLAYRWPAEPDLIQLLEQTGPLIAPSANLQGKPPAKSIAEAKNYFGNEVDFYVDGGEVEDTTPSRLLELGKNGEAKWLR